MSPDAGRTYERTALVIAITAVTSVVGFAREALLAARFGTTAAADAWGIAAAVVAIASDFLLITGPVPVFLIPFLAERRAELGAEAERRAFTAVLVAVGAIVAAVAVLMALSVRPIGLALAPGYTGERRALLPPLLIWTALALTPIALAGTLSAGLSTRRRFGGPTLTWLAMHLTVIAALVWLAPSMGVMALGAGVAAGAVLMLILQAGALRDPGLSLSPDWSVLPKVPPLVLPVAAFTLLQSGTLVLERLFAATLPTGQLASLYYAGKLEQLPLGLFGISVAIVAHPEFAELAAAGHLEGMADAVSRSLRAVLLLAVPSAAGLAVLARPIVSLLFERGAFGADASTLTSAVLVAFAIGLVGQSAVPSIWRSYFALKKTREPIVILVSTLAANLVLDAALVRYGAVGLGAAFAVTMTVGALGLAVGLARHVPFAPMMGLSRLVPVLAVAAAALAVAAWTATAGVAAALGHPASLATRAASTICGVGAGTAAYTLVLTSARVPEVVGMARRLRGARGARA